MMDDMMDGMMDGGGSGWWSTGLEIVFWVGLILLTVWLVWRMGRAPSSRPPAHDPRRILEDRFARGEIDEEEFERRTKVLTGAKR